MNDIIKLCGLKKIQIETRLKQFSDENMKFEVYEEYLDAAIVFYYTGKDKIWYERQKSLVCNEFSRNIYSSFPIDISEFAGKMLSRNHHTLSIAESLTGGEICTEIVSMPGVSSHFYEGVVCYSPIAKMRRLGVKKATLDNFGAVSKQTAYEMAKGLLDVPETNLAISTTGLAGPDGDEGKPVGLVYIGIGSDDFILTFENHLDGNRNEIRKKTTNLALFYMIRYLQGNILML